MKTFHTELPVRFGDVDLARIMYFPHIINYLHIALEEFTQEALGVSYYSLINDKGYGFPHVNLQTRFIRGIPYGTHIQVEVGVVNIGNSSLTLRFRFYLNTVAPDTLAVESINTLVCVELDGFKKLRIPDAMREKLAEYGIDEKK